MRAAHTCLDTLRSPTAFRRPQSPTLRRGQRAALRPADGHMANTSTATMSTAQRWAWRLLMRINVPTAMVLLGF
jgi:hypothetical protein